MIKSTAGLLELCWGSEGPLWLTGRNALPARVSLCGKITERACKLCPKKQERTRAARVRNREKITVQDLQIMKSKELGGCVVTWFVSKVSTLSGCLVLTNLIMFESAPPLSNKGKNQLSNSNYTKSRQTHTLYGWSHKPCAHRKLA